MDEIGTRPPADRPPARTSDFALRVLAAFKPAEFIESDSDDDTACHIDSCHSVCDDGVNNCQPSFDYDNFGPEGDEFAECYYLDDDEFLPKELPFYHQSNLPCVQELLRDSQKRSNFSHLDPDLIKQIIPHSDLDALWLAKHLD